jgi:hypothetical protein
MIPSVCYLVNRALETADLLKPRVYHAQGPSSYIRIPHPNLLSSFHDPGRQTQGGCNVPQRPVLHIGGNYQIS